MSLPIQEPAMVLQCLENKAQILILAHKGLLNLSSLPSLLISVLWYLNI